MAVPPPEEKPLERILAAIQDGLTPILCLMQPRPEASAETLRALNRLVAAMAAAISPLQRDIEVQRRVDRQRVARRRAKQLVEPGFICPTCHRKSYDPQDSEQRYCVACHTFAP